MKNQSQTLSISEWILLSLLGLALWTLSGCTHCRSCGEKPTTAQASADLGQKLYAANCIACHGDRRQGVSAPALLPETLARLKKADAVKTIREGRVATQMPGFSAQLKDADLQAVVEYIYSPSSESLTWSEADVEKSRQDFIGQKVLSQQPTFSADPLNLFFVVTHGDHGLTVLDGDRYSELQHFRVRPGLHGGIKYTSDGKAAFAVTRDGWVMRFDVYNLVQTHEVRVGINARNLAVSADNRYLLVGNQIPNSAVVLNASDLSLSRRIEVLDAAGKPSRVSAVYTARPRGSFVVALKDASELWEIPYQKGGFEGAIKTKSTKGRARPGNPLELKNLDSSQIRRVTIDKPLDDFFFDPSYQFVFGTQREGGQAQVVDLNLGKTIRQVAVPGLPHLGSGITWSNQGKTLLATPNLKEPVVNVMDTKSWEVVAQVPTGGSGYFLRSHEKTPYAWADRTLNPKAKDTLDLINKKTLKTEKQLIPEAGKTAAHVEFSRDGRQAWVSVWEEDGAIVVYDTKTLLPIKRIAMKKPSGKYNIFNKTRLSEGTSH